MSEWIRVGDGLPRPMQSVLVWPQECVGIYREAFTGNDNFPKPAGFYGECGESQLYDVTHWMPLPEGPQE